MKYLIALLLAIGLSVANAQTDYAGIWQDNQGILYSIHQSSGSIVVGEILNDKVTVPPTQQGSVQFTSNELDLAINGNGFFVLISENGNYNYTRNGKFQLSSSNEIINANGERLLTEALVNSIKDHSVEYSLLNEKNSSLECSEYLACAPEIVEPRNIIISSDGVVSIRDQETGNLVASDRIVLAWVSPDQYEFSGYPITVNNEQSVSYFYPATKAPISQSMQANANIVQGGLEQLSYERKLWKGYYGNLNANKARVKLSTEQANEGSPMDIEFINESTAKISLECNAPAIMCSSLTEFQDREINKIY